VENIHIEPSRTVTVVAQVNPERGLRMFGRKLVERSLGRQPSHGIPVSVQISSKLGTCLERVPGRAGLKLVEYGSTSPTAFPPYAQETRVLTWWKSKQTCASCLQRRGAAGSFPNIGHSRRQRALVSLRLVDDDSTKYWNHARHKNRGQLGKRCDAARDALCASKRQVTTLKLHRTKGSTIGALPAKHKRSLSCSFLASELRFPEKSL
jgi:hypothetical protein